MPRANVRKRAAPTQQDSDSDVSPEPATQRRRVSQEASEDEEVYGEDSGVANDNSDLQEMAKNMVRLALACEYTRKPIRRQEISEKVLGAASRQFKNVFAEAQRQLRQVFGMEMVELPAKEKVTVQQRRAAQKSTVQNKAVTKWIVRSTLPPEFRQDDVGIIIPPAFSTTENEAKYVGICTFIVSLMILQGGSLTDAKIKRFLRRVGLEDKTPVVGCEATEKLTKRMEKEGYIIMIKENSGAGDDEIYWVVGPRGRVEVGDHGARRLTMTVYGEMDEAAEAEIGKKISRSLALNDRPEPKTQEAAPAEKRGRPRKNARDNDDEDDDDTRQGSDEDDDDDD